MSRGTLRRAAGSSHAGAGTNPHSRYGSSSAVGDRSLVLQLPVLVRRGPAIKLFTLDLLGLQLDIVIVIAVYVMLALGLNIVVGYAGLLDLGYVAFYALGAYTVGWFASDLFTTASTSTSARTRPSGSPGIHLSFWLVLLARRRWSPRSRASSSAGRRCACAATTSRS